MKYIIKLDFNGTNYFIRVNPDNSWDELYDPNHASYYPTKKAAKAWVVDNTTMSEYAVVVNREDAIKNFNEWAKNGMVRRSFEPINNSVSRPYDKENDSPIDVLNWWFDYYKVDENTVKYEHYETWPKLYSVFNTIWDVNEYHNLDYTETYISVEIFVTNDVKRGTFNKEFSLIKDRCTLIDDEGYRTFPIFEDDLCKTRSPALLYKSDNDVKIIERRYGEDYYNGDLKGAFEYMKHNIYYTR